MVELRRIKVFLFVMLVLQFSAENGQTLLTIITRVGDDVTLPCENIIKDQVKCDGTTWLNNRHPGATAVEFITLGKINRDVYPKARAERLNVSEKCSLVIKNVKAEDDVGRYTCRQFRSNQQQSEDLVDLSVVSLSENQLNDPNKMGFSCSVVTFDSSCRHTVQWFYEGDQDDIETTPLTCLAEAVLTIPHLDQKSKYYKLLTCKVTHESGQIRLFGVGTESTTTGTDATPSEEPANIPDWLHIMLIIMAVGSVAVLIIVAVLVWRKTKGRKRQTDKNITQMLKPAAAMPTQEANPDAAAPEEGVAYASISYNKTNAKATVRHLVDHGDESDAVTYSTVKEASSSSDGASPDPNCLYSTVNKKKETVLLV